MISLRDYIVNEVSSDLLMKAAKKAKKIGDKRAYKFFNASIEKAKEEFDNMSTDAKEEAKKNSKKIFDKLKLFGKPYSELGEYGTKYTNKINFKINGKCGFLTIFAEENGVIPSKKMLNNYYDKYTNGRITIDGFDKLLNQVNKIKDDDQLLLFSCGLATSKEVEESHITSSCNWVSGIMIASNSVTKTSDKLIYSYYKQYRPNDSDNSEVMKDLDKLPDNDLDKFLKDVVNKISE